MALDFDGYAVGGVSVGEDRAEVREGAGGDNPPLAGRPAAVPDGSRPARKTFSTPLRPGSICSIA